jgi:predicted aspartyl protease
MEIPRPSRQRQAGLEVIRRIALALFTLLVLQGNANAACKLQNVATLEASRGPNGLLLVPVSIGGQRVSMLLDTGAERGVIDVSVMQALNLTPMKIATPPPMFNVPGAPFLSMVQFSARDFYLADGTQLDHFAKVPSLAVGASHFENMPFLLARFDEKQAQGMEGILGSNVLRNFDVEVDPAAAKVNLFSPDHCEGKVVYWAPTFADLPIRVRTDGAIELDMTLDGHDLTALLDTGAAHSTITIEMARRIFDFDPHSPAVEHVSGEGNDATYRMKFTSLVAGDLAIKNPHITIVPDPVARKRLAQAMESGYSGALDFRNARLVLGMDILQQLHFYIAYREQKLYFTAAAPSAAPAP